MAEINPVNPNPRELDQLLTLGENETVALMAEALNAIGIPARSYNARDLGLVVTGNYGEAEYKKILNPQLIIKKAKEHAIVFSGFQGIDIETDDFKTTSRGGSDATAVTLSAALKRFYERVDCVILKEIDGIYAIDPRIIPEALRYNCINYSSAIAFTRSGASVLMPRSVEIADRHGIIFTVRLSPTVGKSDGGTVIGCKGDPDDIEGGPIFRGIAVNKYCLIKISNLINKPGVAAGILERIEGNIKEIIQEHAGLEERVSLTFTVKDHDLPKILAGLKKSQIDPNHVFFQEAPLAEIVIIDPDMEEKPRYTARIARVAGNLGINIEMLNTVEEKILLSVENNDETIRKLLKGLAAELKLLK